jgi:hypothetical protein
VVFAVAGARAFSGENRPWLFRAIRQEKGLSKVALETRLLNNMEKVPIPSPGAKHAKTLQVFHCRDFFRSVAVRAESHGPHHWTRD